MTAIAIDGPAASGKSTVARLLAKRLGFEYVNSGAIYRAITWYLIQEGASEATQGTVDRILKSLHVECGLRDGGMFLQVNGEDPSSRLHSEEVARNVSWISGVPAVRHLVLGFLRAFAEQGNIVMEGRDIGTVVFPDTPYKFYLDALPEERIRRRTAQGLVDEITARDRKDSSRAAAPLKVAEDAVVIDSTHLTPDDVVSEIVGCLMRIGFTTE